VFCVVQKTLKPCQRLDLESVIGRWGCTDTHTYFDRWLLEANWLTGTEIPEMDYLNFRMITTQMYRGHMLCLKRFDMMIISISYIRPIRVINAMMIQARIYVVY